MEPVEGFIAGLFSPWSSAKAGKIQNPSEGLNLPSAGLSPEHNDENA